MYETYDLQEHICKELEKRTKNGIKSTAELDTIWKLIDSYKNLLKIDMLQEAGEYSHDGEYSERRKRDSMGRYSRNDGYDHDSSYRRSYARDGGYSEAKGDYMEAKHSYRTTRSPESKRDMNVSLHDCMTKLKDELQDMMSSADTREERDKIKEMIQEIGRLA